MVKINKYLILIEFLLFNIVGQSIIQSAATIQTTKEVTKQDLELIKAAYNGDKDKVEELIRNGANINATDKNGNTVLIFAVWAGYKEIVELLIKAGADVNAVNESVGTALIDACASGYKEIVELLIKHGANVNATNHLGDTALIWSARGRHKEIVELLIKAKADINACDIYFCTALLYAARYKYKEIVELLLKAGANIEHKNKASESIEQNQPAIVKMIEDEPSRREAIVKRFIENNQIWIKENLGKKITEATSEQLFSDISKIIAEYSIEYTNIPLEYRLSN